MKPEVLSLPADLVAEAQIDMHWLELEPDTAYSTLLTRKRVKRYWRKFSLEPDFWRGAFLYSPQSACKTFWMTRLLLMSLQKGIDSYFMLFSELVDWGFRRMSAPLKIVKVLGLDGLKICSNEGLRQVLPPLLRTRRDAGLTTHITSELDLVQIAKEWSPEIARLISESCEPILCELDESLQMAREQRQETIGAGVETPGLVVPAQEED